MGSRITIVMPNYNHAAYLPASVGAVLSQTRPADEIIIIDDASTDDSLAVIDRLTSHNANVTVVRRRERGGVVSVLNLGLELASGDIVAFLGADDCVSPDFLETLTPLMEVHAEAAFACARVELYDRSGSRSGERPIIRPTGTACYLEPDVVRRHLRHADNFFLGQVTLYRTKRLREMGGFDPSLGSLSDSILQRRLAVRWGYVFVPRLLGVWRVHGSNYSVSSVTNPHVLEQMVSNGRRVLETEPLALYPSRYPELFERRLRFNSARLLTGRLGRDSAVAPHIATITHGNQLDRMVISCAARLGPIAPGVATAWLALRLQPFSLIWLAREWCWRAMVHDGKGRTAASSPGP